MPATSLRQRLGSWFFGIGTKNVRLLHDDVPAHDEHADYVVVYEGVFEPRSPKSARVTIWQTADDQVAVGIADCARIAAELGIGCAREGFAGGHEPLPVPTDALLALLTLLAKGHIAIKVQTLPVVGLVSASAAAATEDFELLRSRGYPMKHWIRDLGPLGLTQAESLVRFDPWD